jgi:hypothetical protein
MLQLAEHFCIDMKTTYFDKVVAGHIDEFRPRAS